MNIEHVRHFAKLQARKAELEAELRSVKADLAKLEEPLLDQFAEAGMQSTTVDGRLVYMQRTLRAKLAPGMASETATAHVARHFPEVAPHRINWQTLSATLRERESDGLDSVPEELAGIIEADEEYRLRSRKA